MGVGVWFLVAYNIKKNFITHDKVLNSNKNNDSKR